MPNPDELHVLRKEIQTDLAAVERLARDLAEARGRLPAQPTQENLAYLAYLLHGIYTGWESAFHRIAVTFENRLDPARWHAQLLRRMSLDLPGIRPAVIDAESRERLEELRAFRHFFRHSYSVRLRPRRLTGVLETYDEVAPVVAADLKRFLDNLDTMANVSEQTP
jgi:hypothetical protein